MAPLFVRGPKKTLRIAGTIVPYVAAILEQLSIYMSDPNIVFD